MRIRVRRVAAALAATGLAWELGACGAAARDAAPRPAAASAAPTATRTAEKPECPNPDGQLCRGALRAGEAYTTRVFTPSLAYQVPASGWSNQEDTHGNFLLVPPENDLPGVDAGTSDFLGVYTSIAPSRITRSEGCVSELVPGAGRSPAAMAAWFARQRDLVVSRPAPVRLGGLEGVVVDLRTRAGVKPTSCVENGRRIELAGLFSGVRPTFLDHTVTPGMTMRLYLLGYDAHALGPVRGHVLGVELDDVDAAPGDLDRLTRVAKGLVFNP